MKSIAMIPARMGSQRLKKKNLRHLRGVALITRAIRKCCAADVFDEVWVNSEDIAFKEIALSEGVNYYQRPKQLGDNNATSEQYIADFLENIHCDYIVQVHSIAPLLTVGEIKGFVEHMLETKADALMSCSHVQIECALNGKPVNFTFTEKTNSQNLDPVQRISWSITGWKAPSFVSNFKQGKCATYAGEVGFFPVDDLAGHVIKTEQDLQIAEALYPLRFGEE